MKEFIELVKQLGAAIEDGDPGQISEIYVFHVLRYINEYEERESALIAKWKERLSILKENRAKEGHLWTEQEASEVERQICFIAEFIQDLKAIKASGKDSPTPTDDTRNQIALAEAQFVGWYARNDYNSILELCDDMNLKPDEWDKIKQSYGLGYMKESDRTEIDQAMDLIRISETDPALKNKTK